jgi:hypothetical protein
MATGSRQRSRTFRFQQSNIPHSKREFPWVFWRMSISVDVAAFLTSSGAPKSLIDTFQSQDIGSSGWRVMVSSRCASFDMKPFLSDGQVLNALTEAEFTSLVAEAKAKSSGFTMTLGQQKKLWLKIVKFRQRRVLRSSSNYSESPSPVQGSPELSEAVITSFSNPGSPEPPRSLVVQPHAPHSMPFQIL